jgi:hypothetical protein
MTKSAIRFPFYIGDSYLAEMFLESKHSQTQENNCDVEVAIL